MAKDTLGQNIVKMILEIEQGKSPGIAKTKTELKDVKKHADAVGLSTRNTQKVLKVLAVNSNAKKGVMEIVYLMQTLNKEVTQVSVKLQALKTGHMKVIDMSTRTGVAIADPAMTAQHAEALVANREYDKTLQAKVAMTKKASSDIFSAYKEHYARERNIGKAHDAAILEDKKRTLAQAVAAHSAYSKSVIGSWQQVASKAIMVAPIWMIIRGGIQAVTSVVRESFQFLLEWETLLSKIKVVGGDTSGSLERLSAALLDVGQKFAVSITDLGEGARLWAQQGKSYEEIIPLMETTALLSKITGRTMADSVEDLTSAIYSFGIEAKDTKRVVDALVAVDRDFAITTDVLVSAMRKTGPVAKQMNIPMEDLLGIITATHLATREAGESVGNAWKTIFTRMTTTARDTIQNLADVPIYMNEMGEATKENTGTFRPWLSILKELSASYKKLDDAGKSQLTFMLSGGRQVTKMTAYFQSFEESLKAAATAYNSEGAAERANQILMDTTEQKLKQVQLAWFNLIKTVGDTRALKTGLDGLTSWINQLTAFTKSKTYDDLIMFFKIFMEYNRLQNESAVQIGKAAVNQGKTLINGAVGLATGGIGGGFTNVSKPIGAELGLTKKSSVDANSAYFSLSNNLLSKTLPKTELPPSAPETGGEVDRTISKIESDLALKKIQDLRNYGVEEAEINRQQLEYLSIFQNFADAGIENKREELQQNQELLDSRQQYTDFTQQQELLASKLVAYGYDDVQIAQQLLANKINYLQAQGKDIINNEVIKKQQNDIKILIQAQVDALSGDLQGSLTDGLTKLLGGDSTLQEFGNGITKTYKDAILGGVAQSAVNTLFGSTGLGEAFGSSILGIQNLFNKKPTNFYDSIWLSGQRAAETMKTKIIEGGQSAASEMGAAAGGGGGEGALTGNSTNDGFKNINQMAKIAGGVINAGLVGYSAYNNAGGGTKGMIAGGIGGLGGLLSMAPGATGAIGGLLMVVSMMFGKKQKESQKTVETELKNIATKIQVSNKELQVVNRNLVALKNEKTFILPESAYFSSKIGNIEDSFSVHSSRGLVI